MSILFIVKTAKYSKLKFAEYDIMLFSTNEIGHLGKEA
jgi:hypothetical protein